jgi:precorrin-6B methylase 1
MGAPQDVVASIRRQLERLDGLGEYAGVWPDNAETVRAFASAVTQWRTATLFSGDACSVVFVGLDYAGVRVALDAVGTDITPDLWRGLQIMEAEALAALNGG